MATSRRNYPCPLKTPILSRVLGVTLTELMIVLVVLAILVSLAHPVYQGQLRDNRRKDGQRMLLEIMQEQQKYYSKYNAFTTDLIGDLGFTDGGGGRVISNNQFYLINAQSCDALTPITECIELFALAQGVQVDDGNLTYNSRNQKTPLEKW